MWKNVADIPRINQMECSRLKITSWEMRYRAGRRYQMKSNQATRDSFETSSISMKNILQPRELRSFFDGKSDEHNFELETVFYEGKWGQPPLIRS